jgi:predicted GH43/DUF377 family glycosyl hydrolase
MLWEKLGLIIRPQKRLWWMQTHAFVPTVYSLGGSEYRVYFSGRDSNNISHIGYAEIDLSDPLRMPRYSENPVLTVGELGCFDDNGVTPSCVIDCGEKTFLYYIGWNKRSRVRMGLVAGLAVSNDRGKTFTRVSRAPLMGRTDVEPYNILTGPTVIKEDNHFKMWYVSCMGWVHEDLPIYNIKYAESLDGVSWERPGITCIDFKSFDEHSLARPYVLKDDGRYKMWYAYKGTNYRIGYAESDDGKKWQRLDSLAGIDVSKSGYDSEMIEFANVVRQDAAFFMFYSGNNYGIDGVALAQSEF